MSQSLRGSSGAAPAEAVLDAVAAKAPEASPGVSQDLGSFPAGHPFDANVAAASSGAAQAMAEQQKQQIAVMTGHSWNIFRYLGDYLHLFGIFALLLTLLKNKSCQGISRSTQILYCLVFTTRYLDLMHTSQTTYLVVFKITYITTSFLVLMIFWRLHRTYEHRKDTCSLAVILLPCFVGAVLLTSEYTVVETLWTFSQFLEGFAMVPQYIFCYRDRTTRDLGVSCYVLSLGGYRVFYAANWIYKKVMMPTYLDLHSWTGGIIEIMFFCDYVFSRLTGASVLRAMVLKVDEKINEIQEKVEMKVLGSSRERSSHEGAVGEPEIRMRRRQDKEALGNTMDV